MQPTIKEYHDSKNTEKKTCICANCSKTDIPMNGEHCYSFGIFLCFDCYDLWKTVDEVANHG